jgi:hypothetical protein
VLRYNTGLAATLNNIANALLLRANLHIASNKPCAAFVPKLAANSSTQLIAHLFKNSSNLKHLDYNCELLLTIVGISMLYACFVWSVFTLLKAFLECKTD